MSEPQYTVVAHGSPLYQETVALRQAVLRTPLGLQFTPEELAAEAGSHHLALQIDGALAGCLVLKPREEGAVQIRQLAVAPALQRQGLGTGLVVKAEDYAREQGYSEMVLEARVEAVAFYERLGYAAEGEVYEHVGIPHRYMRKALNCPGSAA